MLKKLLAFILTLCFFSCVYSQDKTEFFLKQLDSTIYKYKQAKQFDSITYKAHATSITFYRKKDYKNALKYGLEEVNAYRKIKRYALKDSLYKNSLFNLGVFYNKNSQFYYSIKTYKIVIDSFETSKKTYQSYCSIGRNYNEIGDYFQAIDYYKKGLSKPNYLSNVMLFNQYLNFAIVYDNINTYSSYQQELMYLQKADSLKNLNDFTNDKVYILNNNYASYYASNIVYNYFKAKHYYLKSLKYAIKNTDTIKLIRAYNNLGRLLNKQNNDSAFHYIDKGIELSNTENSILPKLYANLAEFNFKKGNIVESQRNLQKTLQLVIPTKIDSSYQFIPDIETVSLSNNKTQIYYALKDKATYLLDDKFLSSVSDKKFIHLALKNLQLADKLLNIIRLESFEKQSKLFWQQEASKIYMLGVKACYLLNKPEQAFYFMEKNKAILLLEKVNLSQLKTKENIPINILEEEQQLKQNIYALENEINNSPEANNSLKNKYYDTKIKYKDFIFSLAKKYPEYYNYKAPVKVDSIQTLKNTLDDDSIVIEYILNETDGFVLAITKDETLIYEINSVTELHKKIENYLNLISRPLVTNDDLENYNLIAHELYITLFPFYKKEKLKNKTNLTIIPDYTLQNIPFESLKSSTKDDDFFIKNYEITYEYSTSFHSKNNSINRNAEKDFLGFAPYSFNYDKLATLDKSKTEVFDANKLFSGEVLTDSFATKESFLSNINNYKIIHLSTHANANDSISPWIAFKNKKLFLNDLYTIKNQAELVMLSACNTSLGNINKGEGVFSLARGFFYSGANSVISSLWNVNDKSNQEIVSSFYNHLKKGQTKSSALRHAKLDYLNNHSLSETSPYYWSSLVLIGNNSKINTSPNYIAYIIALISILLFAIIYLKKKK